MLLSSHILSEVEQLCDRVSIIRSGKTVETGTLAHLRHLTRTVVSFAGDSVPTISGAQDMTVANGRVQFTAASDKLAPVLSTLADLNVQGLVVAPPSLEELFMRHYGDEAAADELEAKAA